MLALVNFEQICGLADLLGTLAGKFYSDDGTRDRIYGKFADGRMSEDGAKVDLYLWMDPDDSGEAKFVYGRDESHRLALCRWFGHDPTTIQAV